MVGWEYCLEPIDHEERCIAIEGSAGLCAEAPEDVWQFLDPLASVLFIMGEDLLVGFKYHAIGSFDLAVGSRMRDQCVVDQDALIFTKVKKFRAGEVAA